MYFTLSVSTTSSESTFCLMVIESCDIGGVDMLENQEPHESTRGQHVIENQVFEEFFENLCLDRRGEDSVGGG